MDLVKTISSRIDDLNRRVVQFLRKGLYDVQTSQEVAPYGIDSCPVKDLVAVYGPTSESGKTVILGYFNRQQLAAAGETRLFSTNAQGELQFYAWLKADGTMEIGGNSKNMVRYQELETAFNELKDDFNTLVSTFNAHTHTGVTPGVGSSGSTATPGTSSAADISPAKIDEIKTL